MNPFCQSLLAAMIASACVCTANATPTLITTLDLGNFPSFGDRNVQSGIQSALASWNLSQDPDLPTYGIGATPDIKVEQEDHVRGFPSFDDDTLSLTLPMGDYNYVFLHWGGPDADESYKNPELYYVGGESGGIVFTAPVRQIPAVYYTSGPKKGQVKTPAQEKQYGLSFYSYYSAAPPLPEPSLAVPDEGSNAVLLGVGFLGLAGASRWLKRSSATSNGGAVAALWWRHDE